MVNDLTYFVELESEVVVLTVAILYAVDGVVISVSSGVSTDISSDLGLEQRSYGSLMRLLWVPLKSIEAVDRVSRPGNWHLGKRVDIVRLPCYCREKQLLEMPGKKLVIVVQDCRPLGLYSSKRSVSC